MKKTILVIVSLMFVIFACKHEKRTKINLDSSDIISSTDTVYHEIIRIGVAAMLSPEYALPAYEEIVQYIGKKLKLKTGMIFTKDYASMNELVKAKKVIAAFVCSGPYVAAHDKWGMELVAAPSMYGETAYYSYILVNKSCPISKFEELEGRKFAFTDPQSNTGTIVPKYELARLGKTADSFFAEFIYTGSHDKSIEAVAQKLVDGAAVDNLIWEYMNNTDSSFTSKTRIIARLGPYCTPPFVIHPDCNDTLKQNIKMVLLNMHDDLEGKTILDKLYIDKFVAVKDDCYHSIREMNTWINKTTRQQ